MGFIGSANDLREKGPKVDRKAKMEEVELGAKRGIKNRES